MHTDVHLLKSNRSRLILVVGVFDSEDEATKIVEKLLEQDFAADRISLLKKGKGCGDDMLGLSYKNSLDRMRFWARQGVLWGGLWGSLTAAKGILPITTFIVEIVGSTVVGAVLGGIAMAAAAMLTEGASSLRKTQIPTEQLDTIRQAVKQGSSIVILHCDQYHSEYYIPILNYGGANTIVSLPISL